MPPRSRRCSSLKYSWYSRSSRLATGAPHPSRSDARRPLRTAGRIPTIGSRCATIDVGPEDEILILHTQAGYTTAPDLTDRESSVSRLTTWRSPYTGCQVVKYGLRAANRYSISSISTAEKCRVFTLGASPATGGPFLVTMVLKMPRFLRM